jgi:hypothetical protein
MHLEAIVQTYIGCWNETDPAKRAALLEQCWEEGAVFQDGMGKAEGRQGLSDYIGMAQQYVPGMALELAAPAEETRGYCRHQWVVRRPDGNIMAKGTNFGQLSPAGRFLFVVGFWDR